MSIRTHADAVMHAGSEAARAADEWPDEWPEEPAAVRLAAMQASLCATVLSPGRVVAGWSLIVAVLALGLLVLGLLKWGTTDGATTEGLPGWLASLGFAAGAAWYDLRVRLDEQVFRIWAQRWCGADARPEADMQAFDEARATILARARGVPTGAPRALDERCRAAHCLLLRQILFVGLQTAALAGTLMLIAWRG